MSFQMIFANMMVFAGMIAAIYYLFVTHSYSRMTTVDHEAANTFLQIIHRRRFGATLMILIAVMFFIATNWYMDVKTLSMSIFWMLLMLMLLWLLMLAARDILAVKKFRKDLVKRHRERNKTILDDFRADAGRDSDSKEEKNEKDNSDHSSSK